MLLLATVLALGVAQASPAALIGTWTGTSTCTPGARAACKNEVVVYRFVRHDAQHAYLYADKIIAGKREPMGALDMQLANGDRSASKHFTHGNTSGTWAYTMVSDTALSGTLRVDPDNAVVRNVQAHRVDDKDVPAAPPIGDYGTPD
ncbi:hypothetical protein LVB87_05970 [Lysobacter sp. KIS68-7]|uniref:hypothetical protein n=1 Tax=Lysobacter sp. KIS68-7 TaxID=2904252 RepID=UPI001E51E877|nr:hypothetical protein [Lysobacter sp. KIS68-7]UHQ20688.1 hypothetical protein LVB87_05970 [Lysobacter sp. KIS68-7]